MSDTPHPVFVIAVVALLGTVGLEYAIGGAVLATSDAPQSLALPDSTSTSVSLTPTPDTTSPTTALVSATEQPSSPVRMEVGRVDACGSTCRDVTARLSNDGTTDLTNVEVYTTIYAGDEIVWVDAERVGTVAAGDAYTTTKRVRVGPGEILQIHSNDGSVTVETIIEFDQGSTVVTEHVDVV